MTISEKTLSSTVNSAFSALFSLIIPGLGQFLQRRRERGILIFFTSLVLAFLIYWSLNHQNIGKIEIGGITTSWLWLPWVLFWIWNIVDAHSLRINRTFTILPGILFAAIILYGWIGW
jgi:TM2 domain-containing membrane protein YozV